VLLLPRHICLNSKSQRQQDKDKMRYLTIASVLFLSISLNSNISYAKSTSLIGSWRGGGTVQPTSGAKEKTRCRATIHKASGKGKYRANYRCSSPMGLITQSVTIRRVGANRYSGSFYNTQYNIRGRISITVKGNRQSVSMRSPEGRGWINLRKR
jgi:hypothetical protein